MEIAELDDVHISSVERSEDSWEIRPSALFAGRGHCSRGLTPLATVENMPKTDVIVVGSGVSGLTTAVVLAETDLQVAIWTDRPPHKTTSVAAGAMWGPYLVEPVAKCLDWSSHSLSHFRELAISARETGVRMTPGMEASRTVIDSPAWADLVEGLRPCHRDELPAGFTSGYRFSVPLIAMPVYLTYLLGRLRSAGGTIEMRQIQTCEEVTGVHAMVNCTGLGSYRLLGDKSLYPIKGHLLVASNPGIDEFFSEDTGIATELCHIYPHGDCVILGGTAEPNTWDTVPRREQGRAILERCAAIDPRLLDVRIREERTGLRPTRPRIRVEEEDARGSVRRFHNYGHGGAGVTVSWGCARDIATMINLG